MYKFAGTAFVIAVSSALSLVQAETVWWDHEYNGSTMLNHGTPDAHFWSPARSYTSDLIYYNDSLADHSIDTPGGTASLVSCPTCIGGSYFRMVGNRKWQNGIFLSQTPDPNTDGDNNPQTNAPAWNKAAGYWPQPSDVGCPGQVGNNANFGESGYHLPATGYGNPGCFPGGATIELRFRWDCNEPTCALNESTGGEGGLPLMYPPMQYQGMLKKNSDGISGEYIEFATWGNRPRVEIGEDWVVVRMVVGSSWEGMGYYIHDDGSLEPGTGNNRGADWQDATGNNQFGRDETERVLTFASNNPYPTYVPEQNDAGWKGFETGGGGDYSTRISSGDAVLELDYIRWAFDKKIAPTIIPEPATMALVGLGGLLFLKRRRAY